MVKSRFNGLGYRLADNTASGGLRAEADMIGCHHCQKLMVKSDWAEDGGWCSRCDGAVCGPCADRMLTKGCEAFVHQLMAKLEDQYRRAQNARMLGI